MTRMSYSPAMTPSPCHDRDPVIHALAGHQTFGNSRVKPGH
jgi:hypothetical protein